MDGSDGTVHIAVPKSGMFDINVKGGDRAVYLMSWNGNAYVGPRSLGGEIHVEGPPIITPAGSSYLEIFARGPGGTFMYYHWCSESKCYLNNLDNITDTIFTVHI